MIDKKDTSGFSRLGIGTVQFGMDYGINNSAGKVSVETVAAILRRAVSEGVTFLDTARAYQESEKTVSRAVEIAGCGEDVFISTKIEIPGNLADYKPDDLRKAAVDSLEISREQLGFSHIDAVMLHRPEHRTAGGGVIWEHLRDEKESGRIGLLGVSIGAGPWEALECLEDTTVDVMQIPFNAWDRRWENVLDIAADLGVVVVNRSTYLQGLLVMTEEQAETKIGTAAEYVRKWSALGDRLEIPTKELALRFVLGENRIKTTLVGVDSLEQFEENLAVLKKGGLSSDDRSAVLETMAGVPDPILNPALWPTLAT
ncbi:MAG: aldo/keto reductase [Spirochaetales bacterium]|jgi:aryl-alcohol dehydrogenase-like predicted oxidoreductase|nr:aldo/keto reductase [Spirochaetales bacterium]